MIASLCVVLAVVAGVAVVAARRDEGPPPLPDIPLDAWAPYWTLDDTLPEIDRRAGSMREVSPFWFNVVAVDRIEVDENADADEAAEFVSAVRSSRAAVVPTVTDGTAAGEMAAILADPVTRSEHVAALVEFAADHDGLDVNYENFAFSDGRASWATTRPNWVAFVEELSVALHAEGKTLTVSVPPVFDDGRTADSGFWVYDHGAIAPFVDRMRIMAYDFSFTEPGPIAPSAWVETTIAGAVDVTGTPEKLVLGIPAYGYNWPTFTSGVCPDDVPGRTTVTARSVDDLIARRDATPVYVEATAEWTFEYELEVTDGVTTCVQTRQVHYVDGDGVRARMDLAREYQLGGVAMWALGFDDDDVWTEILPTVSR